MLKIDIGRMVVGLASLAVLWWIYASDEDVTRNRMANLQRRIKLYRWMAEQCGTRVIALEVSYTELVESNRTI
jgi:hypothetical protein